MEEKSKPTEYNQFGLQILYRVEYSINDVWHVVATKEDYQEAQVVMAEYMNDHTYMRIRTLEITDTPGTVLMELRQGSKFAHKA